MSIRVCCNVSMYQNQINISAEFLSLVLASAYSAAKTILCTILRLRHKMNSQLRRRITPFTDLPTQQITPRMQHALFIIVIQGLYSPNKCNKWSLRLLDRVQNEWSSVLQHANAPLWNMFERELSPLNVSVREHNAADRRFGTRALSRRWPAAVSRLIRRTIGRCRRVPRRAASDE